MLTPDSPDWPTHWPKTFSLDDAFQTLPHLPLVSEEHKKRAFETPIYSPLPNEIGKMQSRNSLDLPFSNTKFGQDIKEYFGPITTKYARMDPYTTYDWHRDLDRPYGLNVLIVQPTHGAITLHRKMINRMVSQIREVTYTPMQPLLFNASIPHCVINNSNQVRFIMSMSFFETTRTWEEAKQWFLNYRIDNYGD